MWFASKIATAAPSRPPMKRHLFRVRLAPVLCLVSLGLGASACSGGKKPATLPESAEATVESEASSEAGEPDTAPESPAAAPESSQEDTSQDIEVQAVETRDIEARDIEVEDIDVRHIEAPESDVPREATGTPPLLAAPAVPARPVTQITIDPPREPTPLLEAPSESAAHKSQYDPGDETLTVIREGAAESHEPAGLWEVAQREKERREGAEEVAIVLTDKNLKEMAASGDITVAESAESEEDATVEEAAVEPVTESTETPQAESSETDLEKLAENEEYWRSGALRIRTEMAEAAARIDDLESAAFQLRQSFYAEDDPFYRDGQIKPSWDRTLEELDDTRELVLEKREELQLFLEEGHRAGALPGWLREGIELEPEIEFVEEGPIHHPGEPVVVEQDGQYDG